MLFYLTILLILWVGFIVIPILYMGKQTLKFPEGSFWKKALSEQLALMKFQPLGSISHSFPECEGIEISAPDIEWRMTAYREILCISGQHLREVIQLSRHHFKVTVSYKYVALPFFEFLTRLSRRKR